MRCVVVPDKTAAQLPAQWIGLACRKFAALLIALMPLLHQGVFVPNHNTWSGLAGAILGIGMPDLRVVDEAATRRVDDADHPVNFAGLSLLVVVLRGWAAGSEMGARQQRKRPHILGHIRHKVRAAHPEILARVRYIDHPLEVVVPRDMGRRVW